MWYVVVTKPRQETRAYENLEHQGGEVFMPMLQTETIKQGRRTQQSAPLFPGYLFLRLDKDSPLLAKVRSTFGVNKLLCFGNVPVNIDGRIIEDLKMRTSGAADLPKFKTGQKVELKEGPFRHYQALFKEYKGEDRAIILLTLLGQQNELVVELAELHRP